MIWSFPHQINLTFGRRAKRLHHIPLAAVEAQVRPFLITAFQAMDWFGSSPRIRRD